MNKMPFALVALLTVPTLTIPAAAQTALRVSPATVPIPLPGTTPLAPDRLRARSPWNLPMTGPWKFKLTHGQIVDGKFTASIAEAYGLSVSSSELASTPEKAFDGAADTRWCASGSAFPQWIAADMKERRHVTSVTLDWEHADELYRCTIEGSTDGTRWTTLADKSAQPGIGNGDVPLKPSDVRYVRVTVLGSQRGWASLRECRIHITENGRDVVWRPQPVFESLEHADDFTQIAFDDSRWNAIPVPSNWEVLGYSLPTFYNVDDTVGLYRRWVDVPASFAGKRIYWRFDGALDGAEIFVNGRKAGYHESGYTAFDVDLTGLIKPGERNLFAVRLSKLTPTVDDDTGDYQSLGGIYRDTSLIAVPETHVHDITVRTTLDSQYRDATLSASVQVIGTPGQKVSVAGSLSGADGKPASVTLSGDATIAADGTATVALSAPVAAPKLWSAEKPNLYYLVLTLRTPASGDAVVERVEQRFGFRQVEIKNGLLLWNGQPIKCTGTCRHDFWASKGFALTDTEWNKDLTMMKAANINAVRTSHYNHAARFLELCDEKGMYILDEVPFCWIDNQVSDPKAAPGMLFRAADTIGRDKNRPCVLAWSLGNENPVGSNTQLVHDLVAKLDPTRPSFASCSGPGDVKGQLLRDGHYPGPSGVDANIQDTSSPAVFTEHPHMFYQKETQDYDPGASDLWSETLIKTWDKLWSQQVIFGSFIWEWQNQGIADKNKDRTMEFWYGKDRLRQENNKGIVDAFRNPKPEWWIVKQSYTPVVVGVRSATPAGGQFTVPITNHYSFTDLSELTCRWEAQRDGAAIKKGVAHIACAPGGQVQAAFPAPAGATALRLAFDHPDGTSVTDALVTVPGSPAPMPPAAVPGGSALALHESAETLTVGNASHQMTFDKKTGQLRTWRVHGRDILTGGPVLNLGEAKTGNTKDYYQAPQPPVLSDAAVSSETSGDAIHVTVTAAVHKAAGAPALGTLTTVYDIAPGAQVTIRWSLDWTADNTNLWEAGLKFQTPAAFSRMAWLRDSYFTVYPKGHLG